MVKKIKPSSSEPQDVDPNNSIYDMTLSLMEKTVDDNPWPNENELLRLSSTLNKVISRKKRFQTRTKSLESSIKVENENLNKEYQTFKKSKTEELNSLISSIEALEEELSLLKEKNKNLETKTGKNEEIEKLKSFISTLKSSNYEAEKKISAVKNMNEGLLKEKQNELEKMESVMESLDKNIKRKEDEERKSKELQEEVDSIISRTREDEEKILEIKERIKIIERRGSESSEKEKISELISSYKKEFDEKVKIIEAEEKESIRQKSLVQSEKIKEGHRKEVGMIVQELKLLNTQFNAEKKKLDNAENEHAKMNLEIKRLQESNEKLERLLEDKKQMLENDEGHQTLNQLKHLKNIEETLKKKIDEKDVDVSNMKGNIEKYKSYLDDLVEFLKKEEVQDSY